MWHQAVPPSFTDNEVAFFLRTAEPEPGSSVLDICCGSGRLALALAQKGFDVTGIDLSEENVALLQSVTKELPVTVICDDILAHEFGSMFDHAVCMGNSFSYFDREGMAAMCRIIYRSLMPGGWFVANTGSLAESLLPHLKERDRMEVGDIILMIQNEYLAVDSVLKTQMKFVRNVTSETRTAYHFVYTAAEMIRILKEAGFEQVNVYGGTDGKAYQLGDNNAYFVARK